jgi:hypothetical protein
LLKVLDPEELSYGGSIIDDGVSDYVDDLVRGLFDV